MSRALVLNASFEPLCVVSGRRAVVLVLDQKAEVVHVSEEQVHSERLCLDVPSVIRLRTFVKVPYRRRAALNRRAVFARDHHRCQYCGARAESIDHVVPKSKGGPHAWDNVVAACRPCNAGKRDRLLAETSMTLRCRPRAPEHLTWVIVSVGAVPEDWHAYLGAAPQPASAPALSA
jgi:5-methylcytosine-specific restriction endonuclease McrA